MAQSLPRTFIRNFLGSAPGWYKKTIFAFLILNPLIHSTLGPFVTTCVLLFQFIFTLMMALRCMPLQAAGLLAFEALLLGLTTPESVRVQVEQQLDLFLTLLFTVASVYCLRDVLSQVFIKLLLKVKSKVGLSLLFAFSALLLSTLIDAVVVAAALVASAAACHSIVDRLVASQVHKQESDDPLCEADGDREPISSEDQGKFRAFLRSLLMHSVVGAILGGAFTAFGEPQNLLVAGATGWDSLEFFLRTAPVTIPVLVAGLLTAMVLEIAGKAGYGDSLPNSVRSALEEYFDSEKREQNPGDKATVIIQSIAALYLLLALALQIAPAGLIGLSVLVLCIAINSPMGERQVGRAFDAALPFTALVLVFFTFTAMIQQQALFDAINARVMAQAESLRPSILFFTSGTLSTISGNGFVAAQLLQEIEQALHTGSIAREHFESLVVAIHSGTSIPSIIMPSGQLALMFLLTSTLASQIRLSFGRMVIMALPYTIILASIGWFAVTFLL